MVGMAELMSGSRDVQPPVPPNVHAETALGRCSE
jgi:hypothetical protein